MGNATTQNIVVARYNNFGTAQRHPSCDQEKRATSAQEQKNLSIGQRKAKMLRKEVKEATLEHTKEEKQKLRSWTEEDGNNVRDNHGRKNVSLRLHKKDTMQHAVTQEPREKQRMEEQIEEHTQKLRFWTEEDGNKIRDNHARKNVSHGSRKEDTMQHAVTQEPREKHRMEEQRMEEQIEEHTQKLRFWTEEDGNKIRDNHARKNVLHGSHKQDTVQNTTTQEHRAEQRMEEQKMKQRQNLTRSVNEDNHYGELSNDMQQNTDFPAITQQSTRSSPPPDDLETERVQLAPITKFPNDNHDFHIQEQQQDGCEECTHAMIDPNPPDSHKEVKVIDMVQYFNNKHGYKIRETPVNLYTTSGKTVEPVIKPKVNPKGSVKESYQLCDEHRNQVATELVQAANVVTYKTFTPYSGPRLREEDEVQRPPTIDIKLPRYDEGYQSDSESERARSATPQKTKRRPRLYKVVRRGSSNNPLLSGHTPHPHCCDSSLPCKSQSRTPISERPLYCTPVASLQTTQDILNCRPMQVIDTKSSYEEDTTKNRMPERLSWKKQGVSETASRKKVAEMKNNNSAKARELMKKDSLHEKYPQEADMR